MKDYRADGGNGAPLYSYHDFEEVFIPIREEAIKNGKSLRLNLRYSKSDCRQSDVHYADGGFHSKYSAKPIMLSDVVLIHVEGMADPVIYKNRFPDDLYS